MLQPRNVTQWFRIGVQAYRVKIRKARGSMSPAVRRLTAIASHYWAVMGCPNCQPYMKISPNPSCDAKIKKVHVFKSGVLNISLNKEI
uniref:Uncharacterized protein n=1 Tax=Ciona intestinalis TaxID=7719 RepID=H2Y119_CIOIN